MFTTRADSPTAYRGLWGKPCSHWPALALIRTGADGFRSIYRTEGVTGLYRGTILALVGVGNGALQFMTYEEMKRWGFERKKRQFEKAGKEYTAEDDKLVRPHS